MVPLQDRVCLVGVDASREALRILAVEAVVSVQVARPLQWRRDTRRRAPPIRPRACLGREAGLPTHGPPRDLLAEVEVVVLGEGDFL